MLAAAQRGRGVDRLDVSEVLCAENGVPVRLRNLDVTNIRMGNRASHECDLARPGNEEISHVLSAAAQKSLVLLPQNGCANSMAQHLQALRAMRDVVIEIGQAVVLSPHVNHCCK
jgi:hypothetical protein